MAMHVMLPRAQALDTNGQPDSGATLTVYESETTTLASIYSDDDLSVALDNPMSANARGVFPRAYIAAGTYKVVLTYSDATTETYDLTETGVSNISSAVPTVLGWSASDSKALARSKLETASSGELASLSSSVSSLNATVTALPTFGDLAAEDTVTNAFMDTGQVVQSVYAEYLTNASITNEIPLDDSIPQIGEGTEIVTASITPKSATNKLRIRFRGVASTNTTNGACIVALFQDATGNAIASSVVSGGSSDLMNVALEFEMTSGTTSSTTFRIRVGRSINSYTLRLNGSTSARYFGGKMGATLVIEEIKV